MELFVQMITAGGVALAGGLWIVTLLETWSTPWLLGSVSSESAGLPSGSDPRSWPDE